MNKINILILLLLVCSGCSNESPKQEPQLKDTIQKEVVQDRFVAPEIVGTYIVDDYPFTDDMLRENKYNLSSGNLSSFEQMWFINDSLQQLIIISIGTDYFRMGVSHCYTKDALKLIEYLNIYFQNKEGNAATKKEIEHAFDGFLKQTKRIGSENFITNKGIKLGDSLQKILNIYGLPDSSSAKNSIDRYQWTYNGDTHVYWDTTLPTERPVAKNSFGHSVVMLFKDDKLIAQILLNDIP